jgi:hypothetical protein
MANKHGSLLATLGKRMLGFGTSSSACCAARAAAEERKASEAKSSDVGAETPMPTAHETGCCAPSSFADAGPSGSGAKPSI